MKGGFSQDERPPLAFPFAVFRIVKDGLSQHIGDQRVTRQDFHRIQNKML